MNICRSVISTIMYYIDHFRVYMYKSDLLFHVVKH